MTQVYELRRVSFGGMLCRTPPVDSLLGLRCEDADVWVVEDKIEKFQFWIEIFVFVEV